MKRTPAEYAGFTNKFNEKNLFRRVNGECFWYNNGEWHKNVYIDLDLTVEAYAGKWFDTFEEAFAYWQSKV